ncbi:hypothetical protein EDF34_2779 [Cellulomonas sp. PhB150]|nr:hypothetical protein EDF34_2779 [Cellulomonas sp. PhB150]
MHRLLSSASRSQERQIDGARVALVGPDRDWYSEAGDNARRVLAGAAHRVASAGHPTSESLKFTLGVEGYPDWEIAF